MFREDINFRCYHTIRLLEQGYNWYPIAPEGERKDSEPDEISLALNGGDYFPVDSVVDWYRRRSQWEFSPHRTNMLVDPVTIKG